MTISFADLKIGDRAKILDLSALDIAYQAHLLSLGLLPDTAFTVVRIAPFGDPVEIQFKNTSLCLRKKEAQLLKIARETIL